MKKYLLSLCGGNKRGYEGTKEEIEKMFAKCFEESKSYHISQSSINSLDYDFRNRQELEPSDNGLYVVSYWSKW